MSDEAYMAEAFRLAERALFTTDPNPRVGCVLVKNDTIVGRGYHLTDGKGHAEANALLDAGAAAKGSTAYVTLEPCSFQGRTPSCAQALVQAGVTRVVSAMADPHPNNRGRGYDVLREGGLEVVSGVLESEGLRLNPGHICKYENQRPFVRLKLAMTMDGKTALANGESQWITGAAARRDVQRLRARSSAIVTGVQSVVDDDPSLTVRAEELGDVPHADLAVSRRRPIYVLDPNFRAPQDARLRRNVDVFFVGTNQMAEAGNNLVVAANTEGKIDLKRFLTLLATEHQHNEVLFECGPTLAGALVAEELFDEIVLYMAPKFMGCDARSLLNLPEIDTMGAVKTMKLSDVRQVGDDIRVTLKRGQD